MSTTTSSIAPRAQRTSLAWPGPTEKCMPRSTPRAEREWLSCTQSSRMPSSARRSARKVSTKNPRASRCTTGSTTTSPGSRVGSALT